MHELNEENVGSRIFDAEIMSLYGVSDYDPMVDFSKNLKYYCMYWKESQADGRDYTQHKGIKQITSWFWDHHIPAEINERIELYFSQEKINIKNVDTIFEELINYLTSPFDAINEKIFDARLTELHKNSKRLSIDKTHYDEKGEFDHQPMAIDETTRINKRNLMTTSSISLILAVLTSSSTNKMTLLGIKLGDHPSVMWMVLFIGVFYFGIMHFTRIITYKNSMNSHAVANSNNIKLNNNTKLIAIHKSRESKTPDFHEIDQKNINLLRDQKKIEFQNYNFTTFEIVIPMTLMASALVVSFTKLLHLSGLSVLNKALLP